MTMNHFEGWVRDDLLQASKWERKAKKRNKSVSRDARALLFYRLKSRVAFFFFSRYICLKKKMLKKMKNPGREKIYPRKKKLTGVSELLGENKRTIPLASPQDHFDDIQRRSWETSDAWSNQLVLGPW